METWKLDDIPDLTGKIVIVTGGNSGLGFETVKVSASRGAKVVMASRNIERGQKALEKIMKSVKNAKVYLMHLDLADIESVKSFSGAILEKFDRLDYLFNNAGVMMTPFMKTKQGFEYQFGINHLGHYALTGLLLPLIKTTPGARILHTSSIAHKRGKINFDDMLMKNNYDRSISYSRSKVANVLFAYELQRKLEKYEIEAISIATHPGVARTNLALQEHGIIRNRVLKFISRLVMPLFLQSSLKGALSQLRAAYDPNAKGGEYYGPAKESRGNPILTKSIPYTYEEEIASKLWQISEEMTGIVYQF